MAALRENLPLTSIRGLAAVWVAADHVQSIWFFDCGVGLASALAMGSTAVDIFFGTERIYPDPCLRRDALSTDAHILAASNL